MRMPNAKNWIVLFLSVATLLVISAVLTTQDNMYNPNIEVEKVVIRPETVLAENAYTDIFYLDVSERTLYQNTLLFYTNHQEVFVKADGTLIYSLEAAESIFGRTAGAMWNKVTLPESAQNLEIRVSQVYPSQDKLEVEFFLGNVVSMYDDILASAMIELLLAGAIVVIGVALILYWTMVFRKDDVQRAMLYLGMFAVIFGVWNIGETEFVVFMFDNRAFWSYMAFTCLQIMCLPALYFFYEFLEVGDKYIHKGIALYVVVTTIISQVLHLTGLVGVKESGPLNLISIGLVMGYLLFAIIKAVYKKVNMRRVSTNIVGMVILAITACVDIGTYFVNISSTDRMAKVGFLIYAILLGMETTRVARERMHEEQKMELIREMAVKDMLTGCQNRNSYNQFFEELSDYEGYQVIGFDLNDLKKCNDTRGHQAGDAYIIDAAKLIGEVFGDLGPVYRIGGDEFSVLATHQSEEELIKRKKTLQLYVEKYRLDHPDGEFGIACGFATFDSALDNNLEDTRSRADMFMYKDKKELKA